MMSVLGGVVVAIVGDALVRILWPFLVRGNVSIWHQICTIRNSIFFEEWFKNFKKNQNESCGAILFGIQTQGWLVFQICETYM